MSLEPFHAIVALAEAECELAETGRVEELELLQEAWAARLAELPVARTREQRALVSKALDLQQRAQRALRAQREAVAAELRQVDSTRTGVQGYGAGAGQRPVRSIDQAA